MRVRRLTRVIALASAIVLGLAACTKVEEKGKEDLLLATKKVGLGIQVSKNGKGDKENGFEATQNATFAVLTIDKEGKILEAKIDTAQSKFKFNKEGKFFEHPEEAAFKTKKELGDEYGMRKASGIGKEWNEQIEFIESNLVGKTLEDVKNIKLVEKDGKKIFEDADLISGATLGVEDYMKAVVKAFENAKEVKENTVEKVGIKAVTKMGSNTAEIKDGKFAAQFETTVSVVGLGKDKKVEIVEIDTAQNKVDFTLEGFVPSEKEATTKRTLGNDYGMKAASKIGKEWFEQMDAFQDVLVGKTLEEISNLKLEGENVDAISGATIKLGTYKFAIEEAIKNIK